MTSLGAAVQRLRGWNKGETARHFFVSDDTIRTWLRRADDDSLVQTHTPVNRFPDFVRSADTKMLTNCPHSESLNRRIRGRSWRRCQLHKMQKADDPSSASLNQIRLAFRPASRFRLADLSHHVLR